MAVVFRAPGAMLFSSILTLTLLSTLAIGRPTPGGGLSCLKKPQVGSDAGNACHSNTAPSSPATAPHGQVVEPPSRVPSITTTGHDFWHFLQHPPSLPVPPAPPSPRAGTAHRPPINAILSTHSPTTSSSTSSFGSWAATVRQIANDPHSSAGHSIVDPQMRHRGQEYKAMRRELKHAREAIPRGERGKQPLTEAQIAGRKARQGMNAEKRAGKQAQLAEWEKKEGARMRQRTGGARTPETRRSPGTREGSPARTRRTSHGSVGESTGETRRTSHESQRGGFHAGGPSPVRLRGR